MGSGDCGLGALRESFGLKLYLQVRYNLWRGMNPEIEFDWDEANVSHVARHKVSPEEAEQVILNDPVDLRVEITGP